MAVEVCWSDNSFEIIAVLEVVVFVEVEKVCETPRLSSTGEKARKMASAGLMAPPIAGDKTPILSRTGGVLFDRGVLRMSSNPMTHGLSFMTPGQTTV